MPGKPNPSERRQFGRRHTQDRGWIALPGRPALPCVIRNISEGGALLVFERTELLPFAFVLTIEGSNKDYGCEIRHHYGDRVGIGFVDLAIIGEIVRASYGGTVGSWIGPRNVPPHR